MKAATSRRPSGFTLVELLVVIVIIAALASLGISGGLKALEKAKRTTSMAAARGVESAVNNYFTEYGSMPTKAVTNDDADTTVVTNVSADVDLLNVLLGFEDDPPELNVRRIKFLSVTEGKSDANGIIYKPSGDKVDGLYDPWGGPYYVILDTGFDEKVKPATAAKTLNGRRVAVWSNGADGVNGGGKAEDDVKTW
jgi:prepilin-type N-terminal cleavage/methylation domain-containing protein